MVVFPLGNFLCSSFLHKSRFSFASMMASVYSSTVMRPTTCSRAGPHFIVDLYVDASRSFLDQTLHSSNLPVCRAKFVKANPTHLDIPCM